MLESFFRIDHHNGPPASQPYVFALVAFPGMSLPLCTFVTFEICLLTAVGIQARALHFLKKFSFRSRGSGGKSKDTISPVALPTQQFQHAHSSVDLLRKPDISHLIGLRVEDGPIAMDTDDSSQDASASSNSPRLQARRYSTLDSLRPIHATFTAPGAPSTLFHDQGGLGNKFLAHAPVKLPAPAPLFLRSNLSLDAVVQPPGFPVSNPEIPLQISLSPEMKPDEQAVQHVLNNDTAPPLGDVLSHDATLSDLTLSTSSYPGTFSGLEPVPFPQYSTSETVQECSPFLSRHSASSLPPFCVTTERGLRLSPSVITRQPMPLLNLPTLPPPPPPAPDLSSRQKVPMRSIPLLSRHGRSNVEYQADHENATLGDSDEDDGDECEEEHFADALSVHQSDDEDEGPSCAGVHSFETSQKQRMRDVGSLVESSVSPTSPQSDSVDPNPTDNFSFKSYVSSIHVVPSSTSLEMYPFSPNIPCAEDDNLRRALDPDLPTPGARLESRPNLYHAASRSMVHLSPTRNAELGLHPRKSRETVRSHAGSASGHTAESAAESEESDTEAVIGRLLRRTSMPSFLPTSDPPPYPTFNPRPKESRVVSHEEEGDDPLPSYSNSLYLIAIMPCKMEFSSPGVQARDRKWKRVVCELEGTTFRVYKCPPGASGAGVLGDWWEKHVGVGDVASPNPPRTRKKEEQFEQPAKLGTDEPPASVAPPESSGQSTSVPPAGRRRRRSGSQSSMATQSTMMSTPRPAKRTSGASFLSPFKSSSTTQPEASIGETSRRPESRELELLPVDVQSSRSSLSHESSGRASPAARRLSQLPQPRSAARLSFLSVTTGRAQWRNGEIPKPPKSDLLRAYTLQHAESGLGNDYLKRKNVIRVRLEGEQFLLQAHDVPAVVEWIEVQSVQIW